MTQYLITGVAGFIGSNIARALLSKAAEQGGMRVRGIDDFSTGRRENLVDLDGLELIEGDISRAEDIQRAMEGVDYVIHQAAIPSVSRSVDDPIRTHHANVTGTLQVLEAARVAGAKRVVYAASSSAYGDTPTLPKVETMKERPLSPYAVSKLAGEHYVSVYSKVFGLPAVALRYFNVFGPHQDPNSQYAAAIPKFIRCVLRGESPTIFGDGTQTRDFTHVDNVVEANLKALEAPEEDVSGEVFNIACGERIDLLQLLEEIYRILGKRVEPVFSPTRPGDVRDSLADITKAREKLGYTASVGLREGLERTAGWYRGSL